MSSIPLRVLGKGADVSLGGIWVAHGCVSSCESLERVASILPESGSFSLGGLVT